MTNREPLVSAAVLTSVLGAALALLKAFGVDITNAQQSAISGLALVVAPLLVALVVRPKVSPVDAPAGRHEAGFAAQGLLILVVLVLAAIALLFYIAPHINLH
jgi:hypothetical protein